MSRLRRLETTGKIFFVTCNVGKDVNSLSPPERDLLLTTIGQARQRLHFRLFAYVVMPNHWHALILPAPEQTIGAVMHTIKRTSALHLNSRRGTTGSLWQARFFDRFLRRVKDFNEAVDYIHTNPVRDGFTSEPGSWPWSSYGGFAGRQQLLLPVDRINLPLDATQRI
ncbi:MAG: transposase [Terriglobia bacterium]